MKHRGSGILMHITSLPSRYGVGDLGPAAHAFVDELAAMGQRYWQVLPVNPTNLACGSSPYSGLSVFAGNPDLISPELLLQDGLLPAGSLDDAPYFPESRCDYTAVRRWKDTLLRTSAAHAAGSKKHRDAYGFFCQGNAWWLDDYALFVALKNARGGTVWNQWGDALRDRREPDLARARAELAEEIAVEKHRQWVFFEQWRRLREHCASRGIALIGDIPIYVSYDSSDVWSNPRIFKLDHDRRPTHVAGVPPDYFSATGQLWGNPVYDWQALVADRFAWWVRRMEHTLRLFDVVRVDHFRGLVAYWEVPAGEHTAVNGRWVEVPYRDLFAALGRRFFHLPLIAEDLGIITADVRETLREYGLPGMKVLQFAFSEDKPDHPYLPHTYERGCVVYTGTHDNNTTRGWFECDASPRDRERFAAYVGRDVTADTAAQEMMRLALASVADVAIIPLQDVLGLGAEARMNTPSVPHGNWEWRLRPGQLTDGERRWLREATVRYGRA